MDINLQIQLAKEAGFDKEGEQSWEKAYKDYLGMVENPLPFGQFKVKTSLFDSLMKIDPLKTTKETENKINSLAIELGF